MTKINLRYATIDKNYFIVFKFINKIYKQARKQSSNQTSNVACFFWSDAMAAAIACGRKKQVSKSNKQTKQRNNKKKNQPQLVFIIRNRPCSTYSKSHPLGLRKWLLGLADLSEGGWKTNVRDK